MDNVTLCIKYTGKRLGIFDVTFKMIVDIIVSNIEFPMHKLLRTPSDPFLANVFYLFDYHSSL